MCVNKESKFKDETAEWIIEFVTDDEMNPDKTLQRYPGRGTRPNGLVSWIRASSRIPC